MARKRKAGGGTFVDLGTFSAPGLADRRARAYVPSSASARPASGGSATGGERERPVLVMFDGQNVFGDEGSFVGGWHADRVVERMAAARAPVIVAIDHGGADRVAELGAPSSPKLAAFVDLVVDGVLPAAHARLKLGYGPGAHFTCGSSMGGLAALYMHFRRPEVFGGAVAMSPSIWYARRGIFDFVAQQTNPYRSRVWLDAGAREGAGRLAPLVQSMAGALRGRGWSDGPHGDLRVACAIDARGRHDEASWGRRLPRALRFLFGP